MCARLVHLSAFCAGSMRCAAYDACLATLHCDASLLLPGRYRCCCLHAALTPRVGIAT